MDRELEALRLAEQIVIATRRVPQERAIVDTMIRELFRLVGTMEEACRLVAEASQARTDREDRIANILGPHHRSIP